MKVDIKDLMDCYFDDSVRLDDPKTFLESRPVAESNASFHATSRNYGKRSLLVAAVLLLVVTAAVATPLVLSRTAGHGAMTEGTVPTESVQNELPSELPTAPQEGMPESAAAPQSLIPSYTITGAKVRES